MDIGHLTNSIMESLSAQCTPAKQRYDACFNSWLEGYLQPALDHVKLAQSSLASSSISAAVSSAAPGLSPTQPLSAKHTPITVTKPLNSDGEASSQCRPRIVTSWANVFPSTAQIPSQLPGPHPAADMDDRENYKTIPEVDTRGKSRAQIKAEEYERHCGQAWAQYQTCLKRGISDNPSLTSLLEQAREEHPLKDQKNLQQTVSEYIRKSQFIDNSHDLLVYPCILHPSICTHTVMLREATSDLLYLTSRLEDKLISAYVPFAFRLAAFLIAAPFALCIALDAIAYARTLHLSMSSRRVPRSPLATSISLPSGPAVEGEKLFSRTSSDSSLNDRDSSFAHSCLEEPSS